MTKMQSIVEALTDIQCQLVSLESSPSLEQIHKARQPNLAFSRLCTEQRTLIVHTFSKGFSVSKNGPVKSDKKLNVETKSRMF